MSARIGKHNALRVLVGGALLAILLVLIKLSQAPEVSVGAIDEVQSATVNRGQLSAEEAAIPSSFAQRDNEGIHFRTLDWTELMPADDLVGFRDQMFDHDENSAAATQFGSFKTVLALEGMAMRLPGYVVPVELDAEGRMREFFFVPYFGACLHVPPPPPNQILYVRLPEAQVPPDLWEAYWLKGTLRARRHDDPMASAAYSVDAPLLVPYDG